MARHAGLVGTSLVVWAIGNYAYYLIAGRVVGPATYGLVSALIGVLAIIAWPCTALQWATARTLASAEIPRDDAVAAYRRALRWAWSGSVAVGAIGIAVVLVVRGFDDGVATWALVVTCLSAVPLLPYFVSIGALQGESRYVAYSASSALTGVLRAPLMLPLLLVAAGSAAAVISGSGLSILAGLAAAVWVTRDDLRQRPVPSPEVWRAFTRGLGATVAGLIGFSSLVSVGVVVAKFRLPADDAGFYGAANVLGRALLVVPQAVAIVLLPRVARRRSGDLPTGALLAIGVAGTVVIGVAATLLCVVAGTPIITITFGSQYEAAAAFLPQLFAASTAIGAVFVFVNHHVARSDHRFAWALAALAVVHLAFLIAFGVSVNGIIAIDGAVAVLALVVHEVLYRGTGDSLIGGTRALVHEGRAGRRSLRSDGP